MLDESGPHVFVSFHTHLLGEEAADVAGKPNNKEGPRAALLSREEWRANAQVQPCVSRELLSSRVMQWYLASKELVFSHWGGKQSKAYCTMCSRL